MNQTKRIGLLGGTFDPVHIGHLHIAACALHELSLDEVLFIPAGSPPHKPNAPVTAGEHRLKMLQLATADTPALRADPMDLLTDAPSYTSDLLKRTRLEHPDDELWFIIGADSLRDFGDWHKPHEILKLARLAVAQRPGFDIDAALRGSTLAQLGNHVDAFSSVPVDLSATVIRERLRARKPVDWLVPSEVVAYIQDHALYR